MLLIKNLTTFVLLVALGMCYCLTKNIVLILFQVVASYVFVVGVENKKRRLKLLFFVQTIMFMLPNIDMICCVGQKLYIDKLGLFEMVLAYMTIWVILFSFESLVLLTLGEMMTIYLEKLKKEFYRIV